MSWNNTNDDYASTGNDNYGQEHKLKLGQVGDKIKSAFGKDSKDDSYGSSGNKHDSYGASGRDHDSYRSSGQDQDTYGSSGRNQDSFGAGNDDTFGSSNRNKDTYGNADEGFGSSGRGGNTYLASGDNHRSSVTHESEFGSTGNQPGFSGNDYNASAQFGSNRGNDYGDDSGIGGDTYGSSGRNQDEFASSNEFGSARSHDHDYENPRKGFGTTGGGGDSYGLGYVEN